MHTDSQAHAHTLSLSLSLSHAHTRTHILAPTCTRTCRRVCAYFHLHTARVLTCAMYAAMRSHADKEGLQQIAILALATIIWSSKEIQASAREAGADRWSRSHWQAVEAGRREDG